MAIVSSGERGRSGECEVRELARRGGAKKVGCGSDEGGKRKKNEQDAVEVGGAEGRCGLSDERISRAILRLGPAEVTIVAYTAQTSDHPFRQAFGTVPPCLIVLLPTSIAMGEQVEEVRQ